MFRSIIVFAASFGLFISCSSETEFKGKFGFSPDRISPGDEVTIMYNSDSTDLAGQDKVNCIAYLYNQELIKAMDIPLTQNGAVYTGRVQTNSETLGILLKFKSNDVIDNNDKKGYVIYLTDSDGKSVPGSIAGYAAAINRWGAYYLGLDRDKQKALSLFNEEFRINPQTEEDFLQPYFESVYAVNLENREKIITEELKTLENYPDLSEKQYILLAKWYTKLKNEEKAEQYEKLIEERFPWSEYIQEKLYLEYRAEKNFNRKIGILQKFEEDFPESRYIRTMYDLVANAYRDRNDYDNALGFLKQNKNKVSSYRFYIIVKRMLEENANMNIAREIIELGDIRNRLEVENPTVEKPVYFSESEWRTDREYHLGLNSYAYGKLLYKTESIREALPLLIESVELTGRKEGDINELYSKVLVESGEFSKAIDEITLFIKTGNSTFRMKDYLQEAYINENGTSEGFEKFSAQFESAAREKLISKLKKDIVLEPAPDFSLLDLDGKTISLSDFKDKTVIVDFWATWCGPCLASFPGMKKAVEKFRDNQTVKFLFVNSWERVDDKQRNAEKFFEQNDYPFHVLLDENNNVIEKYKVSGIPTKFIIDGNGNIRFKSVGFQGTADQLVEELSLMISMLN